MHWLSGPVNNKPNPATGHDIISNFAESLLKRIYPWPMEEERRILEEKIIEALKQVYDPEIPVNVYDLGLIYDLRLNEDLTVYIQMTLTAPNCPIAEDMPGMVRTEIMKVEGVKDVVVDIVFDPPWDIDRINDAAKLELGLL